MQELNSQSNSKTSLFGFAAIAVTVCTFIIAGLYYWFSFPVSVQDEDRWVHFLSVEVIYRRTSVFVVAGCLLSLIFALAGLWRKEKRVLLLANIVMNMLFVIIALIILLRV